MNDQAWESIYRQRGHVFTELPPSATPFIDLVAEQGCRSVLDLGCGNGRFLVHFARRGLRVTGLDNSPTALALAREWLAREALAADLFQADTRVRLPLTDQAFEALVSSQVIHHARLAQVLGAIAEIERVLKPGGLLLVSVPYYRPMAEMDEEMNASEEIEHHTFVPRQGPEMGLPHHLFTPEEFAAAFPGFEIVALQRHGKKVLALTGRKKLQAR